MSRKLISVLLALIMTLTLALPTFAVDGDTSSEDTSSSSESSESGEESESANTQVKEVLASYNNPNGRVMSLAKQGYPRSFPEDSLHGIKYCMDNGVDIVAVSVQATKDGQLVLMEDSTLDRMLVDRSSSESASGKVASYTLDELQTNFYMRSGHGGADASVTKYSVASLAEAVTLSQDYCMLYITNGWAYASEINTVARSLDACDTIIIGGATSADAVKTFISETQTPVCHISGSYIDGTTEGSAKSFTEAMFAAGASQVLITSDSAGQLEKSGIFSEAENTGRVMVDVTTLSTGGEYRDMIADWEILIQTGYSIIETDYPTNLTRHLDDIEAYRTDLTSLITQVQSLDTSTYEKKVQRALTSTLEDATEVSSKGNVSLSEIQVALYDLQEAVDALETGEEIPSKGLPWWAILLIILGSVLVLGVAAIFGLRFYNKQRSAAARRQRKFKNEQKAQSEANLRAAVAQQNMDVEPLHTHHGAESIIENLSDTETAEITLDESGTELFAEEVPESEQETKTRKNPASRFIRKKK